MLFALFVEKKKLEFRNKLPPGGRKMQYSEQLWPRILEFIWSIYNFHFSLFCWCLILNLVLLEKKQFIIFLPPCHLVMLLFHLVALSSSFLFYLCYSSNLKKSQSRYQIQCFHQLYFQVLFWAECVLPFHKGSHPYIRAAISFGPSS